MSHCPLRVLWNKIIRPPEMEKKVKYFFFRTFFFFQSSGERFHILDVIVCNDQ
jgi:hypothetical protein